MIKIFFRFGFLFFILFLYSCGNYKVTSKSSDKKVFFTSKGFALIYEDTLHKDKLISRKINNDELAVMHSFLKRNTPIKIYNPLNSKVIETKVFKNADYPEIFNIVISKKIATLLNLDLNNPYVEVVEFKKNKTFVAKEGNIFDEEKNVATSVPVSEVEVSDLSSNKNTVENKKLKNTKFTIIISDFYYLETAENLKKNLIDKTNISNFSIKKISNNKYRLLVGPFKNFNTLKSSYISLNSVGFDDLNIYRE